MADEPMLNVAYYAVCILDLLGQQEELAKWASLPADGHPTPDILAAIRNTAGRVMRFKKQFAELFERFSISSLSQEQQRVLEKKKPGMFSRFKTWPLKTQQFSDTFVFYCPIKNEIGDISVQPIFRMLSACGIILLGSLTDGIPIRGSICIGTGMEIEDGNFYGPALAEAHHLESKVAAYPRIVVSEEVVRFVNQDAGFSDDADIDSILGVMAQTCRMMIYKDTDSKAIVDFLGPTIRQFTEAQSVVAAEKVHEFVEREITRFASKEGAGSEELAKRYRRLQQYVDARLPLWKQ